MGEHQEENSQSSKHDCEFFWVTVDNVDVGIIIFTFLSHFVTQLKSLLRFWCKRSLLQVWFDYWLQVSIVPTLAQFQNWAQHQYYCFFNSMFMQIKNGKDGNQIWAVKDCPLSQIHLNQQPFPEWKFIPMNFIPILLISRRHGVLRPQFDIDSAII
jgi:hypothetical protein